MTARSSRRREGTAAPHTSAQQANRGRVRQRLGRPAPRELAAHIVIGVDRHAALGGRCQAWPIYTARVDEAPVRRELVWRPLSVDFSTWIDARELSQVACVITSSVGPTVTRGFELLACEYGSRWPFG